jgi:2-oxo-4-hydroxy-4-carboxy-5-ureidoimidazoline decarboxylase
MESSARIDDAPAAEARVLLHACCGSHRWVERMLALRPFGTTARLLVAAREQWFTLDPGDWHEAFSQHPRIGDREGLRARFPTTHQWAEREQSGVGSASDDVLAALAAANREYEDRFGFVFIVCASGKTAEEMLDLLRTRMGNDPATELNAAAEEQAKIAELRLRRLA